MNNVASRDNQLGLAGASGCGLSLDVLGQRLQVCDALADALLLLEDTNRNSTSKWVQEEKKKIRHCLKSNRASAENNRPAGD